MKPVTPLALGAFFTLSALICAAVCVTMIVPDTPLDALWAIKPNTHSDLLLLRPASTAVFVILALAMTAAALGCFARRRWGRALAVLIFAVHALGDAIRAVQGNAIEGTIGVAIAGAVIWWITRPQVKAQFS